MYVDESKPLWGSGFFNLEKQRGWDLDPRSSKHTVLLSFEDSRFDVLIFLLIYHNINIFLIDLLVLFLNTEDAHTQSVSYHFSFPLVSSNSKFNLHPWVC